MLENSYFSIIGSQTTDEATHFTIHLLPEHPVYQGHFPDNPVSPGVCNLQMIKECAQHVAGRSLTFDNISQYRLLQVLSPNTHTAIDINLSVSTDATGFVILATATAGQSIALSLKAHAICNEQLSIINY